MTLWAQVLFHQNNCGKKTRAFLPNNGKGAAESAVRDFEEGRNEEEEGSEEPPLAHMRAHTHTHSHVRSLSSQFQSSVLSGEAALGFWL